MAFPSEFLLELKNRNDIESVISPYVELKRRGRNLVGLCPFHNEKTPSFTVYGDGGNYHCFGCGAGGDVITFTMQIENLDYPEAVRRLAERAGLEVPFENNNDKSQKEKGDTYEINREAARYFHSCLMSESGKNGLRYLTDRGLSVKTIRHFGLGFAPDGWENLKKHLMDKGYTERQLLTADLLSRSNSGRTFDRFRNRVMFPIINLSGKVIGFGGRAMPGEDKNGAKYLNTADTPVFKKSMNMYALNFAKSVCSERVILAEGYMDVIALHQAGFTNAVAALGTAFTPDQARLLGRYTKEVVVTLDADAAGKKATDKAIKILSEQGIPARILRIPNGKDPDEFIKNNSPARFEALLNGAVSDVEYRLYMAAEGVDLATDDGKLQYLKNASAVLSELEDGIAIDLYAGRLATKYGVAKSAILSAVAETVKKNKKVNNKKQLEKIIAPKVSRDAPNPQKQQFFRAANAEETVIRTLVYHPDCEELVRQNLSEQDFLTDLNRKIFKRILEILQEGRQFDLCLLGEDFTPKETGYVSMIINNISSNDYKRLVLDAIAVIKSERKKADVGNLSELSDEEWAKKMADLSKDKFKNNI